MFGNLDKIIAANGGFIGTDGSDFDVDALIAFAKRNGIFNGQPDIGAIDANDGIGAIADKLAIDLMVGAGGSQSIFGEHSVIVGGPGGDFLSGIQSVIFGGPGDDYIDGRASFVHGGPGSDSFRAFDDQIIADLTPDDTINFYGTASFREDLVFEADGNGNTIVHFEVREGGQLASQSMTLLGLDPQDIDPASILAASGDDYPADTTTTGLIPLDGTTVHGDLETSGDVDWLRVELPAGEQYRFYFSQETLLSVDIHDADGDVVVQTSGENYWVNQLNVMSEEGGTYYVAVSGWQGSGDYDIYAVPDDSAIVEII